MKSMTGYGHASHVEDEYQLEVEIKSYNNRYLDIYVNLNPVLSPFEAYVTGRVKEVASRGKVEVAVRLKVFESRSTVHVDSALLDQYLASFREIEERKGVALGIDAASLLSIEGLFTTSTLRDSEEYRAGLEEALTAALADFAASRAREGEETRRDLERLGRSFAQANDSIARLVDSYEDWFRNILMEKYRELDIGARFDETKLMQEVAALLVKYSINEEQNRLRTHVKQYFSLLESDEPVGKKLDFLCQEMNREVNTTASKSQNVEITLHTVQMKDDLENIREQIRNIE